MRLMGLDVGDKTIGVALAEGELATPLTTLPRRGHARDFEALGRLVAEYETERLVVGLPINMDGTEGPAAGRSRRFAAEALRRLGLPVVLWDERLSTYEAQTRLAHLNPRKRREVIDQVAAQVILESYLLAGAPARGPHGDPEGVPGGSPGEGDA